MGNVTRSRGIRAVPLLAVLALLLTACLGEGGGTSEGGGEGGAGTVTVYGAFTADEQDLFEEAIADWEEQTGNTVQYTGSSNFETLVNTQFEGGNPPDIAIFPQPGLLLDLANQGQLQPLSQIAALPDNLPELFIPGFVESVVADDGETYGLPYRMAFKSAVWYPVPEYEEAGYPIPETFDQFVDVVNQIREQGDAPPLLLGAESGDATGWVYTDWIEEMVLRFAGPDVYDQWVAHEIPFDDPQIAQAAQQFGDLLFTEGNVLGGPAQTVSIPFGDAPNPMFEDPPAGWLHRQGNFITGFFPQDVQDDLESNVGVFRFPGGASGGYEGDPVLLGGDLAARSTNENPAADDFMNYLTTQAASEEWASAGGFLSPLVDYDLSVYPNEIARSQAQFAQEADVAKFDASDLMPGAVGTGTFWSEMVAWVSGSTSLEDALANIEASWPTQG